MADRRRQSGRREGNIPDIIYGHYKEAVEALPLERIPELAPRLLDGGVCFGFADPVTNIIANTVHLAALNDDVGRDASRCAEKRKRKKTAEASGARVSEEVLPQISPGDVPSSPEARTIAERFPDEDGEPGPSCATKKRKRKRKRKRTTEASGARLREELLAQIAPGDVPSPPEARTMAERSCEGLVIFLTTYFRHLPTPEALRYLRLAGADLLVAVRLIELDRHLCYKDRFFTASHATKVAINCAAVSAGLPMVDSFLSGVYGLVPRLKRITRSVAADRRPLSVQYVYCLSELLNRPHHEYRKSKNPMDIAAQRIPHHQGTASIEKVPVDLTESVRGVLLDRVHDMYLTAVSRLPMKEFRTHYHHGLLKAGYCYGPFNPVWNIIVNTIWYNTAFPATEEFEVDMISTLRYLESRSLTGLIAFLRASIPEVSEHEAMIYLLKTDLKVSKALRMANQDGRTSGSHENGYKAAVKASSHPKSEEFLEVVLKTFPTVCSAVRSVMRTSHVISSCDITQLSKLLAASAYLLEKPLELQLTKDALDMLSKHKKDFLTEQSIVRAKVKAALHNYEQAKGDCYELCVICIVNKHVGKKINIRNSMRQFSHVNFWATRKNEMKPTLFFAQFSNDEHGTNVDSICYPVQDLSTHDVRCCYCEFQGIRLVHPTLKVYWVGGNDYEKISCGQHEVTNAAIISRGKLMDICVNGLSKQDYIYLDPLWDCNLISDINLIAWRKNLNRDEQLREICGRPKLEQAE